MKIEIVYTRNEHLWEMENIAAEHGYKKTQDCYWVQIFENENGDHIVTTRDDGDLIADPVERLRAILTPAEPVRKHYQNETTGESTTGAALALSWLRRGDLLTVTTTRGADVLRIVTITGAPTKPARPAEDENRTHCKHIAEEAEAYAAGAVHRCPNCCEEIRFPGNVGDKYRCPHCQEVNDVDDWEQLSIWDFLADVFDAEFRVGSDKKYRNCKIMVACGGPNIYIDTAAAMVKLYWWTEYAEYPLSYEARDAIDEWAEEYWNI